jgi:hypothetical protein
MINKQEQQAGNNSTNIQAYELVINNGLTYSEVKEVALDVFRANFYELGGKAHDIARARAEEITEEFLKKLQTENPSGFSQSENPNFQQALFTIQKEYAITGDKELGDLLIDLLVDRSKHEQRSILQIVLNESLSIVSKLTSDQLAVLALVFLFRHMESPVIESHEQLGEHLDKYVLPFVDKLSKSSSGYRHLEYLGCVNTQIGSTSSLAYPIFLAYAGLFTHGFDPTEVASRKIEVGLDPRFFVPCLNDPHKFQVKAINGVILEKSLADHSISQDDRAKIRGLLRNEGRMNDQEIIEKCVSIRPYMQKLFSTWNSSAMGYFSLTSVGIAIGHANIKCLIGEFADLSMWIN